MTCILGIAAAGRVFMGGDSAAVNDGGMGLTTMAQPRKVFRRQTSTVDDMLIGFAGSIRAGQVLNWAFEIPWVGHGPAPYLVAEFIPALRRTLIEADIPEADKTCPSLLIGWGGRLYRVETDYSIIEPANGLAAVGSGSEYAIGAAANDNGDPEARIRRALQIAEDNCGGVRGPFFVEEV